MRWRGKKKKEVEMREAREGVSVEKRGGEREEKDEKRGRKKGINEGNGKKGRGKVGLERKRNHRGRKREKKKGWGR